MRDRISLKKEYSPFGIFRYSRKLIVMAFMTIFLSAGLAITLVGSLYLVDEVTILIGGVIFCVGMILNILLLLDATTKRRRVEHILYSGGYNRATQLINLVEITKYKKGSYNHTFLEAWSHTKALIDKGVKDGK